MKRRSIVLLTVLVLALIIPVTVYAAGYFYCTTLHSGSGGNGTYSFSTKCGAS